MPGGQASWENRVLTKRESGAKQISDRVNGIGFVAVQEATGSYRL